MRNYLMLLVLVGCSDTIVYVTPPTPDAGTQADARPGTTDATPGSTDARQTVDASTGPDAFQFNYCTSTSTVEVTLWIQTWEGNVKSSCDRSWDFWPGNRKLYVGEVGGAPWPVTFYRPMTCSQSPENTADMFTFTVTGEARNLRIKLVADDSGHQFAPEQIISLTDWDCHNGVAEKYAIALVNTYQ